MKEKLKRIFWKLPISSEIKKKISRKRFERIIEKEEQQDRAGNKVTVSGSDEGFKSYIEYVLESYGRKSSDYCSFEHHDAKSNNITIAAYYLTQFHPNPQNDEWWGKGTTEWNNVNQAVPQFDGHYQPRKPGELGYYDLRIKENMQRQIELARNYGIGAFCFYYYWFAGDRLLERPLNMFLKNSDLDIPFFYCWANENWTKRFSGTDTGILMGMEDTEENYCNFIDAVLPDMKDPRYYRIKGKPVISVYRPGKMPNPKSVLENWRNKAHDMGIELYIIAVQERNVSDNWTDVGYDAETEFQPKQIQHLCKEITRDVKPIRKDFSGNVYDYADLINNRRYMIAENQKKKVYPAVMPMWDNTARRNQRGIIFHGSTPALYKKWLADVVNNVSMSNEMDDKLIFINAWNEWGEGTYLEPDAAFGYAYLEATWSVINDENAGR